MTNIIRFEVMVIFLRQTKLRTFLTTTAGVTVAEMPCPQRPHILGMRFQNIEDSGDLCFSKPRVPLEI